MEFISAVHTDKGIVKQTNQDAVLIKEASADCGNLLMAAVCDGMGGLAKGEVASATLIRALSNWFDQVLPQVLFDHIGNYHFRVEELWKSLDALIQDTNQKITAYGNTIHTALGTTATVLLLINDEYYTVNVGDSRIYLMKQDIWQLTQDQTYVQREMDEGRMTPEQAAIDPQRNVLLQCVGASESIVPAFSQGRFEKESMFMLCSDGFRHRLVSQELYAMLNPGVLGNEREMKEATINCVEINKQRRENDNISVALVRTY